jgi:hypothetical protein
MLVSLPACSDTPEPPAPEEPASASHVAVAKVVAEAGIREDEVVLTQAQAIEWPDSSLGCPQKGQAYLPAVTPGHVVQVMTAQSTYTVHVAGNHAVLCEQAQRQHRQKAEKDESLIELVQLARADLAERLGEGHESIIMMSMQPVQIDPDSSSCQESADGGVSGLAIELQSAGTAYTYFAGNGDILACD